MREVDYEIQVRFPDSIGWVSWTQRHTIKQAMSMARIYNGIAKFRIRKIVKTIVWKEGKRVNHGSRNRKARSQTEAS